MLVTISNEVLTVEISTLGAEIQSVKKNGKEFFWNGDPAVWSGRAPVLFPICGGLRDDKYVFEGKEYSLEKHGYARNKEFEVISKENDTASFLLKSCEEDLKKYPFENELKITYTLVGSKVCVEYAVTNTGSGDMYFSIGAHEAYACPNGVSEYSVIFEKEEDFDSVIPNGNLLEYKTVNYGKNAHELQIKDEYFEIDALIFTNLKSRKAMLKNRVTGQVISVEFDGADYFLIWTKPGAKYLCLEPWSGIPDYVDSDYDITKKTGIIKAAKGETIIKKHSFEIE